jgi:hypothetical protein
MILTRTGWLCLTYLMIYIVFTVIVTEVFA